MKAETLMERYLDDEFIFSASRSSGPGGQNINKVNTKVELRFNVGKSRFLSDKEKLLISEKLKNKINSEGELVIVSQSERSQLKNKKRASEKFYTLLSKALTLKPARKATSPTVKSKAERLEGKRIRSEIKKTRKKGDRFPEE